MSIQPNPSIRPDKPPCNPKFKCIVCVPFVQEAEYEGEVLDSLEELDTIEELEAALQDYYDSINYEESDYEVGWPDGYRHIFKL